MAFAAWKLRDLDALSNILHSGSDPDPLDTESFYDADANRIDVPLLYSMIVSDYDTPEEIEAVKKGVQLMLDHGADPNAGPDTPIHTLAMYLGYSGWSDDIAELIRMFLRAGGDPGDTLESLTLVPLEAWMDEETPVHILHHISSAVGVQAFDNQM
jgi:hypothetical protein